MDKEKALTQAREQIKQYKQIIKLAKKLFLIFDYNLLVNIRTNKAYFIGDTTETATALYKNRHIFYEVLKQNKFK